MSITLKRPMFRKGGQAEEGIMELATPRKNYSTGKTREELIQDIFQTSGLTDSGKSYAETAMKLANLGRPSDSDLLTNVILQGGLRTITLTNRGGGYSENPTVAISSAPTTNNIIPYQTGIATVRTIGGIAYCNKNTNSKINIQYNILCI